MFFQDDVVSRKVTLHIGMKKKREILRCTTSIMLSNHLINTWILGWTYDSHVVPEKEVGWKFQSRTYYFIIFIECKLRFLLFCLRIRLWTP